MKFFGKGSEKEIPQIQKGFGLELKKRGIAKIYRKSVALSGESQTGTYHVAPILETPDGRPYIPPFTAATAFTGDYEPNGELYNDDQIETMMELGRQIANIS